MSSAWSRSPTLGSVPEDLVVVFGAPDDDGGSGQPPRRRIGEDSPERVGAVGIEVKLETANLGDVGLVSPLRARADRVHPDEDVMAAGVQVPQPALKSGAAAALAAGVIRWWTPFFSPCCTSPRWTARTATFSSWA